MGHAEMLLAVAGLDELQIKQRVDILSRGDWSSLTSRERVALAFAKSLSQRPEQVPGAEVQRLVEFWGTERALDLIWHTSWCNFMTRVADAFQLPLERTNVFLEPKETPK